MRGSKRSTTISLDVEGGRITLVVDANDTPIGIVSMNDFAREATRAGSRIKDGVARALNTLAAICQPRKRAKAA